MNAGRWDYIFSTIKKLDALLPDRAQVTMTVPFMRAYSELLVRSCHRRGAHAIGGMAAFIPSRSDPEVNEVALAKVREDKERESGDGFDGTWVAHPDLVPVATEIFDGVLGERPNQLDRLREDVHVTAEQLLDFTVPGGEITDAGLHANVSVGTRYLDSWLHGVGAAAIDNLMEDAATAEISRAQVWSWVKAGRFDAGARTRGDRGRRGRRRGEGALRRGGARRPVRRVPDAARVRAPALAPRTLSGMEAAGTKADEIALALEEAIVSGELAPGTVLRQEQVSAQYAVSRTPVREALRRMSALGLVSFEANRGFRVRTLSRQEMWEAFLVRAELESLITGIAADKMTKADLDELDQAEKRFARLTRALRAREPGDDRRALTVEWMHANHGFHDVIYRVADLPYIEQVSKSARRTFSGPAVWAPGDETIDGLYLQNERQHEAIKDALAAGSTEGARVLAREHVLASFKLLETILEQVGAGWRSTNSV